MPMIPPTTSQLWLRVLPATQLLLHCQFFVYIPLFSVSKVWWEGVGLNNEALQMKEEVS